MAPPFLLLQCVTPEDLFPMSTTNTEHVPWGFDLSHKPSNEKPKCVRHSSWPLIVAHHGILRPFYHSGIRSHSQGILRCGGPPPPKWNFYIFLSSQTSRNLGIQWQVLQIGNADKYSTKHQHFFSYSEISEWKVSLITLSVSKATNWHCWTSFLLVLSFYKRIKSGLYCAPQGEIVRLRLRPRLRFQFAKTPHWWLSRIPEHRPCLSHRAQWDPLSISSFIIICVSVCACVCVCVCSVCLYQCARVYASVFHACMCPPPLVTKHSFWKSFIPNDPTTEYVLSGPCSDQTLDSL